MPSSEEECLSKMAAQEFGGHAMASIPGQEVRG